MTLLSKSSSAMSIDDVQPAHDAPAVKTAHRKLARTSSSTMSIDPSQSSQDSAMSVDGESFYGAPNKPAQEAFVAPPLAQSAACKPAQSAASKPARSVAPTAPRSAPTQAVRRFAPKPRRAQDQARLRRLARASMSAGSPIARPYQVPEKQVQPSLPTSSRRGRALKRDVTEEDLEARAFPGAGSSTQVPVSGAEVQQTEFERRLGAVGGRSAEQEVVPESGEVAAVDEESDYSSESSDSSWFAREDVKGQACQ
ncbi:uncharacterized protein SCHCODRAFT_02640656 [Schizophyllum commune H4-8]|nr:uncharacterized protein SCHCODRAFT_02640656 [Schizophyllum commune H4-8]KAI5887070.1 hypothetical protein SCHCODRAFT_02640656 [Schizophyllum commune H4-8]